VSAIVICPPAPKVPVTLAAETTRSGPIFSVVWPLLLVSTVSATALSASALAMM
jgi:hypothetical protein